MKIIFCDTNKELVKKVKRAVKHFPIEIKCDCNNIFSYEGVIVSASNSLFTFGGGLDALIKKYYSKECSQKIKDGNERIGNVIFTITVDKDFKATRELVKNAILFALKETKENEILLLSGLGTGIGGLDYDEFIYCFLSALSEHFGYRHGIKFTKKDSKDWYTGKILYKIGKTLEEKNAKNNGEPCGVGLHLGNDFIGAGNYNLPEKIFFCIYDKKSICGQDKDKIRVNKLLVICELPQWLGYGINGKNILSKINKKFNPEKYNPYQAENLPSKKDIQKTELLKVWNQVGDQVGNQVWDQVWDQVGDQVWNQVRNQVGDQVGDQVWNQVGDQVGDQVRNQVWNQVGDQVGDQVWDQVGDQVWNQVWATSYWAINLHFELGIKHWFGDFLKLGVMVIFVQDKVKFFGKKGKYLGEYTKEELGIK